jgi:hypothetical protein
MKKAPFQGLIMNYQVIPMVQNSNQLLADLKLLSGFLIAQ